MKPELEETAGNQQREGEEDCRWLCTTAVAGLVAVRRRERFAGNVLAGSDQTRRRKDAAARVCCFWCGTCEEETRDEAGEWFMFKPDSFPRFWSICHQPPPNI